MYKKNSAKLSGGVMAMDHSSLFHGNHSQFYNNSANAGGVLYVVRSELILNDSTFPYNQATESGGVLYVLQSQQDSEVAFYGQCNLTHNSACSGGTIYAVESTLYDNVVSGQVFKYKSQYRNDSGGGMYLYRSTLSSRYA